MHSLTASNLSRAEACNGSVQLDGFAESGRWAGHGNAVDRFVQTAKQQGRDAALAEAPDEHRPYLETLDVSAIPDGAEFQVPFAWNVDGRAMRLDVAGRAYPDLGDGWIFGTSDIVGYRDRRVLVWDLKWGTYTDGRDAADDLQLGIYALAASTVAGADEAQVNFARAGWDGKIRMESAVLDRMALDDMADRIRAIHAAARGPLRLRIGDHCTYCPARRGCPAQSAPLALALRADIAAAAREELTIEAIREKVESLSPPDMGRLYERMDQAERMADTIRGIIRDHARQAPIPLPGGKELREVKWSARAKSDEAKRQIADLEKRLEEAGEIKSAPARQVRPMKARK